MNAEWLQHGANTTSMLLCQQFCGSHDSSLVAVEGGSQQGGSGHSRFTGANITLEKAAHGFALGKVSEDFADDQLLSVRKSKWQGCLKWLVGDHR